MLTGCCTQLSVTKDIKIVLVATLKTNLPVSWLELLIAELELRHAGLDARQLREEL